MTRFYTKALTFGLVDPDPEALIKDPNTIAYKTGTLVGEFGAGIAAFFINPVSGVGAVVTTAGKVVQVTMIQIKFKVKN